MSAATPVVPEPHVGSNTTSPGSETWRIQCLDEIDGLLPFVVWAFFGASPAFDEVSVVDPSARLENARREET